MTRRRWRWHWAAALVAAVSRILDPVCQDRLAVLYGDHDGVLVRLVPVLDSSRTRVVRWVKDPAAVELVNRMHAEPPEAPSGVPDVPPAVPPVPDVNPADLGL